jgi:hypothetical protein
MKKILKFKNCILWATIGCVFLISGCDKFNLGKTKQIESRPELDCIVANDFYAMHFSAYIQPKNIDKTLDKTTFIPYCHDLPEPGKIYFSADLIDRDIRQTPIGIRLVEVEETGKAKPDNFKEISVVSEIAAKLYPRGTVEAQATIEKKGQYILYLLIGDAIEEDDKFKINLNVGANSFAKYFPIMGIVTTAIVSLFTIGFVGYRFYKKQKK